VVPDVVEESRTIERLAQAARRALAQRIDREEAWLVGVRSRPSMADPLAAVEVRANQVLAFRARAHRVVVACVDRDSRDVENARLRVAALSPAATLERGYAVVRTLDGAVVRSAGEVEMGDALRIRVADGDIDVTVAATRSSTSTAAR